MSFLTYFTINSVAPWLLQSYLEVPFHTKKVQRKYFQINTIQQQFYCGRFILQQWNWPYDYIVVNLNISYKNDFKSMTVLCLFNAF